MGQQGTYSVVVYDLDAQHFNMDNLDAIVECERSKTEDQGKPWRPAHDERLRDLQAKGVPTEEMAIALKRNSSAVRKRLKKLGLAK